MEGAIFLYTKFLWQDELYVYLLEFPWEPILSNHANLVHFNEVFTLLQVIFLINQEKPTQDGPKLDSA